jgi:hypothetical protein
VSTFNLVITCSGYLCALAGVCVLWGAGWALLAGGLVLFVAGGLASARERA